jgi:hypothetical protein
MKKVLLLGLLLILVGCHRWPQNGPWIGKWHVASGLGWDLEFRPDGTATWASMRYTYRVEESKFLMKSALGEMECPFVIAPDGKTMSLTIMGGKSDYTRMD